MTQSAKPKNCFYQDMKRFSEFVFISDSSLKAISDLSTQLNLASDSNLLHQAEVGSLFCIQQIDVPPATYRQLKSLKLLSANTIELVNRTDNGSVMVTLNQNLIGIGAEIARRIVVTLVGAQKL